eukprot:6370436-Heterocapsa_arctica.AAC.1
MPPYAESPLAAPFRCPSPPVRRILEGEVRPSAQSYPAAAGWQGEAGRGSNAPAGGGSGNPIGPQVFGPTPMVEHVDHEQARHCRDPDPPAVPM